MAIWACLASLRPPSESYSPRRPSCGSPYGLRLTYRRLRSSTANASRQTARVSAIASGETKSGLSAEVWYSG